MKVNDHSVVKGLLIIDQTCAGTLVSDAKVMTATVDFFSHSRFLLYVTE